MRGFRTTAPRAGRASVYPPREDTWLLARFARAPPSERVLEIGTGNGLVAETAAADGARVVATDLNPVALAELAGRARHLDVAPVRTDLAHGLRRFDRILCNPPYLPTPPGARDPDPWANLALDGGPDGCATHARIVAELPGHLAPDGRAFLLESSRQSADRRGAIRSAWRSAGGAVRKVGAESLGNETLEVWEWTLSPASP